jgi:glycosyltransferase involved in cell wall biosynthesis
VAVFFCSCACRLVKHGASYNFATFAVQSWHQMQKLSVVIITLNEERNIGRCLESVQSIADEILVLDSFSSDNTEDICRRFGVRFVQHPFDGHIEQKQWALDQASYQMVLSLDADEALSPELLQSILVEKQSGFPSKACQMNRLTNYCGKWIKHSGWYPDTKLRLFDRTVGAWGGSNPHDKILIQDPKIVIKKLQGDLLHYSFYTIEQHMQQINSFSEIKARVAFQKGKKSQWYHLVFAPLVKFVKDYFIKLGMLDGFYGYVICRNSAHATFLKYSKLKNLELKRNSSDNG